MPRVMFVNSWAEVPLAIQQVVDETVRDITRIEYQSILKKQIPFLEKLHSQYFATATGPDSRPWAALAASTIKRKGHSQILIDSRRLIRSLTSSSHMDAVRDVDERELVFGTSVPYSMYHQQDCGGGASAALGRMTKRVVHRHRSRASQMLRGGFMKTVMGRAAGVGVRQVTSPAVSRPSVSGRSSRRRTRGRGGLPPRPHVGFNVQALKKFVDNVADGMMEQLKQRWR